MRSRLLQCVIAAGLVAGIAGGLANPGCSTAPKSSSDRDVLNSEVQTTKSTAEERDPSMSNFLNNAYGYAIFPTIGKGGLVVGGAYGRGQVYERGRMIGYADLTQATFGLQAGGQSYSEIIAFQDKAALDKFTRGDFELAAQATAVALSAGAGANAHYAEGVSVITFGEKGLMAEAAVGGQKFSFKPV
jgi:lipid-binding SYLF domain-containing protein